jgi:hypothetical protein
MTAKRYLFLVIVLLSSGCATYKFQHGKPPYDKGYVASREGYAILEYTVGKDNTVPDIGLAKERFKRRKGTVEDYYKKMGRIENRFKEQVWNRIVMFAKFMGSVLSMPGRIISAYKYENNPEYRAKIQKLEAENYALEEAHINKLKEELDTYIQEDLSKEKAE